MQVIATTFLYIYIHVFARGNPFVSVAKCPWEVNANEPTPSIQGGPAGSAPVSNWRVPRTLATTSWIDGHISRGYVTVKSGTISEQDRRALNKDRVYTCVYIYIFIDNIDTFLQVAFEDLLSVARLYFHYLWIHIHTQINRKTYTYIVQVVTYIYIYVCRHLHIFMRYYICMICILLLVWFGFLYRVLGRCLDQNQRGTGPEHLHRSAANLHPHLGWPDIRAVPGFFR